MRERLPLTFPDRETYQAFQAELRQVFDSEGITDAEIRQVGSPTSGFKGNPFTKFGPWTPNSDAEFIIYSGQALVQAMELDSPANRRLTLNGKYVAIMNRPLSRRGFYDTSIGQKLKALADHWSSRIYADPNAAGFDFKLSLQPLNAYAHLFDFITVLGGKR